MSIFFVFYVFSFWLLGATIRYRFLDDDFANFLLRLWQIHQGRFLVYSFLFLFMIFFSNLTIDKSSNNSNQDSQNYDIHYLAIFHNQFSIFFEIFPDEGQKGISEPCADDSIDDEFGQIHLSHSRRQRDKMPDYWDKSADKYRYASFFMEKFFCRFQFFLI